MARGRPKTINGRREVLYVDGEVLRYVRNNKSRNRFRSDNEAVRELFGLGKRKSKRIPGVM